MGRWITGDLHVHSHCCSDGFMSVADTVKKAREYCDFMGISGHAGTAPEWSRKQYLEVLAAREQFPDMPIFHTAEQEFPVPRHTMFITPPENREYELQEELARRYSRLNGVEGIAKAREMLAYVERNQGPDCFMIYNHPNAPDVPAADLLELAAASGIFKVMACLDRGERRAKQTWDIGGEWDELLDRGHRIFARCGSDFHKHFTDGGHDYWPGEFVQDHVWVENNTYREIFEAYRNGRFYCTVDNVIAEPVFEFSAPGVLRLEFKVNHPLARVDIVADKRSVMSFENIEGDFAWEGRVPPGKYYRVRGAGRMLPRKYGEGEFEPVFLLNPIFMEKN